jgi:hypothetical protein
MNTPASRADAAREVITRRSGDDFFGSREDAYSEAVREKRWHWYVNDFSARLKPGAKRILMNTRWHEEDVAGRVLEQIDKGIVRGRIISLPAIAEENDVLGASPGNICGTILLAITTVRFCASGRKKHRR